MLARLQQAIIVLALIVLLAAGASATVEQVGIMANGPVFSLTENNGYLYVGQGGEIHVYDATSRDKILHLNWSSRIAKFHEPAELGYRIRGIEVIGNTLFGADDNELFITDITNPALPAPLSSINAPISAMAVSGDANYVYLSGSSGLRVIDTHDKAHPVMVMTIPEGTSAWRMFLSGTRLYLARGNAFYLTGNPQLMIFDISNPELPVLITSYDAAYEGGYTSIAIKGNYVFAVDYYHAVHVIDMTNPFNPVWVANITGINANDIKIQGDKGYVSTRYEGFRVYDITNPISPVYLGRGTSEVGGYTEGIFVDGQYAFLALESMGTEIYDISDSSAVKRLIHIYTIGGVDSITADANTLYIGGHNDGVWAVDKATLNELGFGYNGGRNVAIAKVGDYVYTAGEWANVCLHDVSNPANPLMIWRNFGDEGYAAIITTDNKNLYTTRQILDITNPISPTILNISLGFAPRSRIGDNHITGILKGTAGAAIFDITNRAMPVTESILLSGIANADIATNDNYAIVVADYYINVYNIADHKNPVLLKRFSISGWMPSQVLIVGNRAYISGSGSNPALRVYDLTNPVTFEMVDSGPSPVKYYDGNYLYGISKFGIGVYTTGDIQVPTTPTPTTPTTTVPTTLPTTIPITTPDLTPIISGLSKLAVNVSNPAITLTVAGRNFMNGSVVQWNGHIEQTTYYSSIKLTSYLTAIHFAQAGTGCITVKNPSGDISNTMQFFVNSTATPAPTPIPTPKLPDPIYICLKLVGTNLSVLNCSTIQA